MKQVLRSLTIVFAIFILVSCSNANENDINNGNNKEPDTNEDVDNTAPEPSNIPEAKDPEAPLIDAENAIDQREALQHLFEASKDEPIISILEPGEDYMNVSMFIYPQDEYQPIQVETAIDVKNVLLQILHTSFLPEYGLEAFTEEYETDAVDIKEFSANGKKGISYQIDDGVYGMAFEFNGNWYNPFISNVQFKEDKEKMQNLLELLTQSMNSENEGAYNPIYDHYSIDLNKVKFPSFNEKRVEMQSIGVSNNPSEAASSRHTDEVRAFYEIDRVTYAFHIRAEQLDIYDQGEKKTEDLTAADGTEVIKHMKINDEDEVDDTSYEWKDGPYYYVINTSDTEDLLSDEDVLTIIDSTLSDDRSFDQLDSFQNNNTDFTMSKEEKELAELMREFDK